MGTPMKSYTTVSVERSITLPIHLSEKFQGSIIYIALDPFERSLHVYTEQGWYEVVRYLKTLPGEYEEMRLLVIKIAASAHKTALDSEGRLFISESFERHTGISAGTDVVMVDHFSNVEIMTVSEWDILTDPAFCNNAAYEDYMTERIRSLTDETQ